MRVTVNREAMASAFGLAASVAPARSPRPVLQDVLLVAGPDGSRLEATDLEVGATVRLPGADVREPGRAVLPAERMRKVLASKEPEIDIAVADGKLSVRAGRAEFEFETQDPELFPATDGFSAGDHFAVAAKDLRTLIRRTIYATDQESTRYALGGVLALVEGDTLSFVGTDGRRLAKQDCPVAREGDPVLLPSTVIPVKTLKLMDRLVADDDPPVHLATDGRGIALRTETASVRSRGVEGRYPQWQRVLPASKVATARIEASALLAACQQASIATGEGSRGVDLEFGDGRLVMQASAADVGRSRVEVAIAHDGPAVGVTIDPRYAIDALKAMGDEEIAIDLIDAKNPVVIRAASGFLYVAMPLTRER